MRISHATKYSLDSRPSRQSTISNRLRSALDSLEQAVSTSFVISFPDGYRHQVGKEGTPEFAIFIRNANGLAALSSLDEITISDAYIAGHIEVSGDFMKVLDLRRALSDRHPVIDFLRRIKPRLFGQVNQDRAAIRAHYEFEDDFYHMILDETRTYSQGVYEADDEPLETAMRRKLDFAIAACNLKPGSRVLDVGGGWGAFTEYAGSRGIRVTSLTIADSSERYLQQLIRDKNLPCKVIRENFLLHRPDEQYDAVVILGVIEHMPYYDKVIARLQHLIRPGGYAYLDGSAAKYKYDFNLFINKYIYPGNHCMLSIHDFLAEVQKSDLELLSVLNDRHSYYLTCRAWAKNLEANREEIINRWGRALYCKFHLYLWGVAHNLYTNQIQAYRLVLRRQ